MNATATPISGAVELDDIGDRCRIYRDEFGLDTELDSGTGAIGLVATSVSGVITTPALGRVVMDALDTVPVLSTNHRGHRLWTLLADAPDSSEIAERMAVRLFALDVMPVFPRARIALPTPGDPRRVWLRPPHGHTRPALPVLVDAIAEASATPGRPRT